MDGHTERQTDTPSLACRLSDRGWDCWGRQALFHSRPRSCHLVVHARFNIYARATSPSCAEVSALMLSHVLMFVLLFMRHLVRVCDRNAVSRVPFIDPILVYVAQSRQYRAYTVRHRLPMFVGSLPGFLEPRASFMPVRIVRFTPRAADPKPA